MYFEFKEFIEKPKCQTDFWLVVADVLYKQKYTTNINYYCIY